MSSTSISVKARWLTPRTGFGISALGAVAAGAFWLWRHQDEVAMRRPFNEWTFTHMNRIMPIEVVPRSGPLKRLPGESRPLDVSYVFDGVRRHLDGLHARTYTTSFLVLFRGEVVHEAYPGRFAGPDVRFQLMSLTKSVTSMLMGIALDEGSIHRLDDPVVNYLPWLVGTAFDGATVEDLLDMSGGAGDLEDWTDPDSDINRFTQAVGGVGSVQDVVRSVSRSSPPGTVFNYSTIGTQVVGWVLESATRRTVAQYAAEKLWSRIGMENDAYYFLTRKHPRTAMGGGSLNATTRDVARLGLLMSHRGRMDGEQVIPEEWVRRSRGREASHLQVGALGESGYPHYGYSNLWWTVGGPRRAFTGLGVHGQYLYVDPDADVVVVKTSAWPTADDEERDRETLAAIQAIVTHLEGSALDPAEPLGSSRADYPP